MKIPMLFVVSLATSISAFAQAPAIPKIAPELQGAHQRLSRGPQVTKADVVIPHTAADNALRAMGSGGLLPILRHDNEVAKAPQPHATAVDIQVHANPDHRSGEIKTPFGECKFTFTVGVVRAEVGSHGGLIKARCSGGEGPEANGTWLLHRDGSIVAHMRTSAGHEYNFKL